LPFHCSGVGRKLGEGVQFTVTAIGGTGYAFYASWKTSLVILAVIPAMAVSTVFLIKATQSQTSRANQSYGEAGSIAYYSVSDIRTVCSLNACRTMVDKFCAATELAFRATASQLVWIGLGNGAVMGSFILSYLALTLFGAYLLYDAVSDTGCDPSGSVEGAETCEVSGMDVFGALLGISFAGMGIPQVANAIEALTGARAACYPAIVSMNRKTQSDSNDKFSDENGTDAAPESSVTDGKNVHITGPIPLPPYLIDSSSDSGLKPPTTEGIIEFRDVSFTYPSRPDSTIFKNFSLKIEAGQTVALVGPR
jgi:ATP-binding cassette subfamily B (MDR/TAP) protein 1